MRKRTCAIVIPPNTVLLAQASIVGEGFMGVNFIEDFANVGNKEERIKFPGVLGSLAPEAIPPHSLGDPEYRFPSRGRGWHNDPYRHSMASRGLRSRGYLYHGTSSVALDNIRKRGLDPKHPHKFYDFTGNYVYLVTDLDSAYRWGRLVTPEKGFGLMWWARRHGMGDVTKEELINARTVILRVNDEDLGGVLEEDPWGPDEQFEGDYYRTDMRIPPDKLEVLGDDGKWRRLT